MIKIIQNTIATIILFSLMLIISSCGSDADNSGDNDQNDVQEGQIDLTDFYAFYQKFHKDSIYQIDHISWPLEGLPSDADSATIASGTFYWTRDNWRMHKPFDFEMSEFKRQINPINDIMVSEQLVSFDIFDECDCT